MEIKFRLHSKHADHIDRWVNFAIASKTKELVVDLSGQDKGSFFTDLTHSNCIRIIKEPPYNLPPQLLGLNYGSYLRCLELTTVSLQLPADFKGFLDLKILSLVDMSITDEDVQRMLSKCNLLEFLEISYCEMVTSIRMLHPLDRLKHLVVDICPNLQEIELNCSPTTLKYSGTMVPLIFASTSRLTNISIVFINYQSAISYIITGFPSTLPRLETLTLHCGEREVRDMSSFVAIFCAYITIRSNSPIFFFISVAENYRTRRAFQIYLSSEFEVGISSLWPWKYQKD